MNRAQKLSLLLGVSALAAVHAQSCRDAIAMAEARHAIPSALLQAIGDVESGRADPITGEMAPWPWTVDVNGVGHYYPTKEAAIASVLAARARGIQSIDVGCLQINLLHHPDAFVSLDQAFDPSANAEYAAEFLNQLHDQTRDWTQAAADYHSQTPVLGAQYAAMVMRAWPGEKRRVGDASELALLPQTDQAVQSLVAPWHLPPRPTRWGAALPPIGGDAPTHLAMARGTTGLSAISTGRSLADYRRAPINAKVSSRFGKIS
jgi:hypothetical protein